MVKRVEKPTTGENAGGKKEQNKAGDSAGVMNRTKPCPQGPCKNCNFTGELFK